MAATRIQDNLPGNWQGTNLLRLSWLNPSDFHSPSRLAIARVANGKFLTFTYTWSHEGEPQEGFLLVGSDARQERASGAWVDSWHQSGKVMSCEGSIDAERTIVLQGSYEAPPGPDWGWRIIISPGSDKTLRIVMHNISPEGKEELAV